MYPVIEKDRMLYFTPEGGILFIGNLPIQHVNPTAVSIIELCTGTHTVDEISTMLAEKYDDDVTRVKAMVCTFLEESQKRGNIALYENETHTNLTVCGNKELWVPYYISAELTKKCDLRCIHCYAEAGSPRINELSTERWLDILDQFYRVGTRFINVTGGDPLAHPDIYDILEFCQNRFTVVIPTSGYRIDEDMAARLAQYRNIEHIQISLDGPDPKTHNSIRGKSDSFQKAVRAITLLTETDITVHVAMVVLPQNNHKIEATVKLAKELGATAFGAGRIYSLGRAKGKFYFSPRDLIALDRRVAQLSKKYSDEQFHVRGRDPHVLQTLLDVDTVSGDDILVFGDILAKLMGGNCGAGYRSLSITAEGNVLPCGMLNIRMGEVAHTDVREVLQSPLVTAFKTLNSPNAETCGDCTNRLVCSGCHALAYMYSEHNDSCKWRKMYEECISCVE